jgi:hypothetical protein
VGGERDGAVDETGKSAKDFKVIYLPKRDREKERERKRVREGGKERERAGER